MYNFWPRRGWAFKLTTILVMVSWSTAIGRASDLMGQYCGARSHIKCCEKRSDSCTAPVLGTLCYCDAFCKNTTNDDCCPDYDEVCGNVLSMHTAARQTCKIDGKLYRVGQSFKRNCNDCTCKEDGKICCDLAVCVTDTHLITRIKSMDLGWVPATHPKFWGRKYADTLKEIAHTKEYNGKMTRYQEYAKELANLKSKPNVPKEFDSRYKWPGIISTITDQNWCNTAWAHSTVSTVNDRLRIHSMGQKIKLSIEDMIDCSHSRQDGCLGSGHLDRARNYLRKRGLRSVHNYRRETEFQCANSTRSSRRYRSGPWYMIWGETNIQKEILDSGPVQATMMVYRDFFSYKEGIYRRSGHDPDEGSRRGFQAVRIIGWGENKRGTKYWVAANSWGTEWGESGYFRIRRGVNECGIEEYVFAAWGPPLRQWKPLTSWPDISDDANRRQKLYIVAGPSGRIG